MLPKELPVHLKSARHFVLYWFSANGIEIGPSGELFNDLQRTREDLFDSLWLDYKEQMAAFNFQELQKVPQLRVKMPFIRQGDMAKAVRELVSRECAEYKIKALANYKLKANEQDHVTMFMIERFMVPGSLGDNIDVPFSVIYKAYREFCEFNGLKALPPQWFGHKLLDRGLKADLKSNGKDKSVHYQLGLSAKF